MCFTSTAYTYACGHLSTIDVSTSHAASHSRLSCTFCLGQQGPLPAALTNTTVLDEICPDCRELNTKARDTFEDVPFLQVKNGIAEKIADGMISEGWERYTKLYWRLRGVEKMAEVAEEIAEDEGEENEETEEEVNVDEEELEVEEISSASWLSRTEPARARSSMVDFRPISWTAVTPIQWRYSALPDRSRPRLSSVLCSPRTILSPQSALENEELDVEEISAAPWLHPTTSSTARNSMIVFQSISWMAVTPIQWRYSALPNLSRPRRPSLPCSPRTTLPLRRDSETSNVGICTISLCSSSLRTTSVLVSPSLKTQSTLLSPSARTQSILFSPSSLRTQSALLSPGFSIFSSSSSSRRHSSACLSFVAVSPSVASTATFGSRFQRSSKLPETAFEARMMGLVALAGGMARERRRRW